MTRRAPTPARTPTPAADVRAGACHLAAHRRPDPGPRSPPSAWWEPTTCSSPWWAPTTAALGWRRLPRPFLRLGANVSGSAVRRRRGRGWSPSSTEQHRTPRTAAQRRLQERPQQVAVGRLREPQPVQVLRRAPAQLVVLVRTQVVRGAGPGLHHVQVQSRAHGGRERERRRQSQPVRLDGHPDLLRQLPHERLLRGLAVLDGTTGQVPHARVPGPAGVTATQQDAPATDEHPGHHVRPPGHAQQSRA